MFRIPKIEKGTNYFDQIIEEMSNFALKEREKIQERFNKSKGTIKKINDEINLEKRKDLELSKIRFINEKTNNKLRKIISYFPKFQKINPIYIKLINTTDYRVEEVQDALARLLWIGNTIDEFTQKTEQKIKYSKTQTTIGFIMKKYLGKVNSLFKKNNKYFLILNETSKFMNTLPKFEELYTVVISGFPNVGKSTLMKKITGSNVEIKNYPFTTKGLMFGYINQNEKKILQIIDTPGLLGRDKNNNIEERANIVLTTYANIIIFVIDYTESCGYRVESQIKLLKKILNENNNLFIYISKEDIFNEEDLKRKKNYENKVKKIKTYNNYNELKEDLIKKTINIKSNFNPYNIKVIK